MQFLCQTLEIDAKEIRVDARSYQSAARAHIACSGPRNALLVDPYTVSVRTIDPGSKKRYFLVLVETKSVEVPAPE